MVGHVTPRAPQLGLELATARTECRALPTKPANLFVTTLLIWQIFRLDEMESER